MNTIDIDFPIITFPTREAARARIAELNDGVYYLAHGEYARPHYTARKMRGGGDYYIHASYATTPGRFTPARMAPTWITNPHHAKP
jgi:hypothetical protein